MEIEGEELALSICQSVFTGLGIHLTVTFIISDSASVAKKFPTLDIASLEVNYQFM